MQSIKAFISLILFINLLSSCRECEKLNLSDQEKVWVNHFKVGQIFIFKSPKNKTDTIEITDTSHYYTQCNKVELSKYQYEIFLVMFKFKSSNIYNTNESSISMTTEEWQQRIPYIHFGNLGPHRNDLENKMPVSIDTILGGKNFNSIYYYSKGLNTETYGGNDYFKNFFWNKQFGLIAYTTTSDELFVRIE